MKTFNEYQIWVRLKAGSERNERATYALGLAGESGEVCDLLKKHWGHRQPLDREKLKKELGDVLWYVGAIADQFDMTLDDVVKANVDKLERRYPDGFTEQAAAARADERFELAISPDADDRFRT